VRLHAGQAAHLDRWIAATISTEVSIASIAANASVFFAAPIARLAKHNEMKD
jgi:hypothetical protein